SGPGSITTCDGITRRDFLQVGTLGALGFTLSNLAALQSLGAVERGNDEKSAILIFNLGAPSQLDTWDMKPDAPREIRGPCQPIRTKNPEIQISDMFPLHATIADSSTLRLTCCPRRRSATFACNDGAHCAISWTKPSGTLRPAPAPD